MVPLTTKRSGFGSYGDAEVSGLFPTKITLDDFETRLTSIVGDRYRPYAGALASFAYTPGTDGSPVLVSCRWAFGDAPEQVRASVAYPVLAFEEQWFPADTAVGALLRVLRGEVALGACTLQDPVEEVVELDTARHSFTGWRESAFEASLGYRGHAGDRVPLVAPGRRPYPSVSQALNDWVWRQQHDPRWVMSLHDVGRLRVLLPDTRARIRRVSWIGGTLRVENDRNAAPEDVELQALTVDRRTSTVLGTRAVEPEVTWDVPQEAEAVEVYLVHRDGTLLSHRKLGRGEHHRPHPGDFALRELAEEELRRGEGERVEYKPFIAARNPKEQEVVRTVVAFANTYGGRLYIGVNDDGTPQGAAQLATIGKANTDDALDALVKRIERLVREAVKPVPEVTVSPVAVFGSPVVVVEVGAGEEAPYATAQNDMFIRRGATSRKPDPQTELPSVAERARAREERRVRQERDDAMAHSSWDSD